MDLTQTAALEQASAISTALNDVIDNEVLKVNLRSAYSLGSHFEGVLKGGKTSGGKDGFSVDEVAIKNKF